MKRVENVISYIRFLRINSQLQLKMPWCCGGKRNKFAELFRLFVFHSKFLFVLPIYIYIIQMYILHMYCYKK